MTESVSSLASRVAGLLKDRCTHDELDRLGGEIGFVVERIPEASKRDRVIRSLEEKPEREVAEVAYRVGRYYREFELEEAALTVLEAGEPRITEITRRDIARCYGDDLAGEGNVLELVRQFFPVGDGFDALAFGRTLADEIVQHTMRNPGDWSVEYLFERIGALSCSRQRFSGLVEASLHPLARRGLAQEELVERLGPVLRRDGFRIESVGEESGYPIYRVVPIEGGVPGAPKNLVFASVGPKPEIGLRDAINNDIVILSHAESCLVYERPLRQDGLLWSELVDWYAAGEGGEAGDPARALGQRLQACLASDAERGLFERYFRIYRPTLREGLPALIPQVYLHYDPAVVRRLRHRPGLPRQRMDFLLLLPARARVVIEVDGKHHFSKEGEPSLEAYSEMVAADRDLRLAGYEVYRFGANELVGAGVEERVRGFFDRLFERHGIVGGGGSL